MIQEAIDEQAQAHEEQGRVWVYGSRYRPFWLTVLKQLEDEGVENAQYTDPPAGYIAAMTCDSPIPEHFVTNWGLEDITPPAR